jgi:putative flippase GtrA
MIGALFLLGIILRSLNVLSWQPVRYALVGLANTAVTAVIIFSLMKLGVGVYASNAAGYVVGILFSFVINSLFTFSTTLTKTRFIKFILVCGFCYLANLIAMKLFFMRFPAALYSAQITGMFFYTVAGFLLNKYWAMK